MRDALVPLISVGYTPFFLWWREEDHDVARQTILIWCLVACNFLSVFMLFYLLPKHSFLVCVKVVKIDMGYIFTKHFFEQLFC